MQTEPVRAIPLDSIAESKTNPRKHFDRPYLEELAASIVAHGVLQPVIVRPHPAANGKDYELVVGACRFRASVIAHQGSIPAIERKLSDREVIEIQLVENARRRDITPLEEGDTYRLLMDKHGMTAEEIATKVGTSKGTIYARRKLADLAKGARRMLEEDRITASVALLVARIADPKRQEDAAAVLAKGRFGNRDVPHSWREAKELIERDFMRELRGVPWKLEDAELVKDAGPCTTCPHRSGNQRELFGDAGRADVCTMPSCFEKKLAAARAAKLSTARAEGRDVVPTKQAFDRYGHLQKDYVALDAHCWDDPKGRTYKQLLGKAAKEAVVVTTNPSGDVVELVPTRGITRLLKERGHELGGRSDTRTARARGTDAKHERARRFRRAVAGRAIAAIAEAAEAQRQPLDHVLFWRWLARGLVAEIWHETLKAVCARRGLEREKPKRGRAPSPGEVLRAWIEDQTIDPLRALVVELIASRSYGVSEGGWDPDTGRKVKPGYTARLVEAGTLHGVEVAQVERQVAGYLAAIEKAKKPAKKKAATKRRKRA